MTEFVDGTAPVRQGEKLDLAKLEPYVRSQFPDIDGPFDVEQFPNGHSNLTYLIRLGEKEIVVRRPPFGSKVKSAHDMGREYRVLSKLHSAYGPAPEPYFYCEDESILGAPFYGMQRIRGVIIRRQMPEGLELSPEVLARLCESFIDNLATLHGLDYEAIGLGDLGRPAGFVERQVRGWTKRYYASQTHDVPEVETVSAWLIENLPCESGAALIHNDYKLDNSVLDAQDLTRIVGVLDWEMSTLGDPLMDLGTAICYWIDPDDPADMQLIRWGPTTRPGALTRRQLVDRYGERTGSDVSNIAYYYAFALFKTAVVVQQIFYRYFHGKTQDERFAALGESAKIMFRAADRTIETQTIG